MIDTTEREDAILKMYKRGEISYPAAIDYLTDEDDCGLDENIAADLLEGMGEPLEYSGEQDYEFADESDPLDELDYADPLDDLDNADHFLYDEGGYDDFGDLYESENKAAFKEYFRNKKLQEGEFTQRDYEADTSGSDNGPFDELWDQANHEANHNGENKPAVKGTPHFKTEKACDGNNKPSCPVKNDTYEVKYGRSLNEGSADDYQLAKKKIADMFGISMEAASGFVYKCGSTIDPKVSPEELLEMNKEDIMGLLDMWWSHIGPHKDRPWKHIEEDLLRNKSPLKILTESIDRKRVKENLVDRFIKETQHNALLSKK